MQRALEKQMPSEKQIQRWMTAIRAITQELDEYTVLLSAAGRMRRLKPRRKGDHVSTLIARIAAERNLRMNRASSEEIELNETRARRLRPVRQAADVLTQQLTDTIMVSESQAWWATTALYTTLRAFSRRDPNLQQQLAPAKKFFALGKRKPKAPPK